MNELKEWMNECSNFLKGKPPLLNLILQTENKPGNEFTHTSNLIVAWHSVFSLTRGGIHTNNKELAVKWAHIPFPL